MKPTLQLKLSQHLTLTPQLQQSIRLLQLSTLELNAEVERLLQEHWSAIVKIAQTIMKDPWIPVNSGEHPKASRKKHTILPREQWSSSVPLTADTST